MQYINYTQYILNKCHMHIHIISSLVFLWTELSKQKLQTMEMLKKNHADTFLANL